MSLQFYKDHPLLSEKFKRGRVFLKASFPILCGAMTWVSEHNLIAAVENAGGFGMLACGSLSPDQLALEVRSLQAKILKNRANRREKGCSLEGNFGVNLIVFHPQIQELLEVCLQEKVPYVSFAGGMPSAKQVGFLHQGGCQVIGFAPSLTFGRKLHRMGVDALILEGSEAGGHVGPVSTSVLAQEILPDLGKSLPIFVAGGIGTGEGISGFLKMGAVGCQLGTRFVCAQESIAHSNFKQAFIKAQSRHATLSTQVDPRFPVIPVRGLENQGTKNFIELQRKVIQDYEAGRLSLKEAQTKIELFWAGALRRAVIQGDVSEGSLMAGQSVGLVREIQPVHQIMASLLEGVLRAIVPS